MLKILLYLCMLLPSYEYVVICENLDIALATYGKTRRSLECPSTATNDPNAKSFDRQKRVSHHGSTHHQNKFVVNSPNGANTKKPVVLSRLNKNKHKSNKLDAKKRHIACEMFARNLDLAENSTEILRRRSLNKLRTICEVLDGRKAEMLKREEISASPFTINHIFSSTFTNFSPSTVKYSAAVIPAITPSKIDKIFTRAPTIITSTPSLRPVTQNFQPTTKINLKPTELAPTTGSGNLNDADNVQRSTLNSLPKAHTILTKIFVIPIEEESPNDGDKASSLIQMTFDKALKRSKFEESTNEASKVSNKDKNRSVTEPNHEENRAKKLDKRKKDSKKKKKKKKEKKKDKGGKKENKGGHERKKSSTQKKASKQTKKHKEKKKSKPKKKFSVKGNQKAQKNKNKQEDKKKKS